MNHSPSPSCSPAAAGIICEQTVREKYHRLTELLIARGKTVTTMESCTAGQIASLITDTEGSSAVFSGAFVSYSNQVKIQLGIPAEIIEQYGVYSVETARAMAAACRQAFPSDFGIGITGSFGNTDPNNADSVPGEVFFAIASENRIDSWHCTVPPQPSRLAYKLYMADQIADRLMTCL